MIKFYTIALLSLTFNLAQTLESISSPLNVDSKSPLVNITSPVAGEKFIRSSIKTINWTATDGNLGTVPVSIDIYTSKTSGYKSAAKDIENKGTYELTLPDVTTDSAKIRITVKDSFGNIGIKETPGYFSIVESAAVFATNKTKVDFGAVDLGLSKTDSVIISNTGNIALNIGSITNVLTSTFQLTNPANLTINPSESKTIRVLFTPVGTQNYTDTITVKGANQSVLSKIALSGSGTGSSVINLSISSIDFGYLKTGMSKTKSIRINNSGNIPLTITNASVNNSSYSVNKTSLSVPAGSADSIIVSFIPATTGKINAVLSIAHNSGAGSSSISLTGEGFSYPSSVTISKSLSFGSIDKTANYRMVGIPGNNNLAFAGIFTGNIDKNWRVYYDNGNSENYLEKYDGTTKFNLTPGKGFWVLADNAFSISKSEASVPLANDNTYSIALHQGWNVISNPFEKNISWSLIQQVNGITKQIYDFNGSYSSASTLEPYKGYYIYNEAPVISTLKIPYVGSINTGGVSFSKKSEPKVISISMMDGNTEDYAVKIGFNESARTGYDKDDIFSPPGDFEENRLVILNEKLETPYKFLWTDYRPQSDSGDIFNLQMKFSKGGSKKLVFDGLQYFANNEVYLLERRLSKFYNLKEKSEIEFPDIHTDYNLSLLVGDAEFIEKMKADLLPVEFSLRQNYPNPFNPSTIINFSMPVQSSITLKVYDILGQLVETLIDNRVYNAGVYEIKFDAGSYASGVYICNLSAKDFNKSIKMILVK